MMWLWLACSTPEPPPPPVYVRAGRVGDAGERVLPDGRRLLPLDPGQAHGDEIVPAVADCLTLATVPLGDIDRQIAAGIPSPDTALAFSPDGARLAIGTWRGEVVVVDGWSGRIIERRRLAETAIKVVAWSPDGDELYVGEQSVDAFLHALDPITLASRARFRLADRVESSAPPGADDLYGLYTLPAVTGLHVRGDGRLLVVAAHGWTQEGTRRNRSQVLGLDRVDDRFEVRAQWPDEPAPVTLLTSVSTARGVVVTVGRSEPGRGPEGLGIGGVVVLDGELRRIGTHVPAALKPYFERAFVWDAIGWHEGRLTLGLADGRVWRPEASRDLSTPMLAADVPIAATIGQLVDTGNTVYALTSGTSIPYGAGRSETRPPQLHPAENTLFALHPVSLQTRWAWKSSDSVQGLTRDHGWLAVGVGADDPSGQGVVLLEDEGPGEVRAFCGTGQPVFFRTALAPDGRLAVVSFPQKVGESVRGEYRVQLFL